MTVLKPFKEGANSRAWRALMIVLAAVVVLSVSGYGTVIYIQLMSKVFPSGPLQVACYMGAAANFLLMLVLLVGKFVWFRPGAHEVASWLVTGTELIVAILNMMLAFQLASGPATGFMAAWGYLAPISPIFSMCGAIALIMTSTEMRRRHKAMEIEEEKEQAERELDLAMHQAQIATRSQYVQFVSKKLTEELNSPERQEEMSRHASGLVSKVLAEMSLLQAVPSARQLPAGQFPNARTVEPATGPLPAVSHRPVAAPVPSASPVEMADDASLDDAEVWLEAVNRRIEQERSRRIVVQEEQGEAQPHDDLGAVAGEAQQSPDMLGLAVQALRANPDITDEELAAVLGLQRPASALFWKRKALDILNNTSGDEPSTVEFNVKRRL